MAENGPALWLTYRLSQAKHLTGIYILLFHIKYFIYLIHIIFSYLIILQLPISYLANDIPHRHTAVVLRKAGQPLPPQTGASAAGHDAGKW